MSFWFILLLTNAILGLAMFEWAWIKMRPFYKVNEERDSKYPAYRRFDAKNWRKWKFYPGALTILPIRFISCVLAMIIVFIGLKVITIGSRYQRGKSLTGWRFTVASGLFRFWGFCWSFSAGVLTSSKVVKDLDYRKYLGPDYKKDKHPDHVSTLILNHVSWVDIYVLLANYAPAFAAKKELQGIPVFGDICEYMGCLFITREGSEEKRLNNINKIEERQLLIEKEGLFRPLVVFAEGGTTNGTSIIPFKKGAFVSELSVKPMVVSYNYWTLNPAYDSVDFLPLAIF